MKNINNCAQLGTLTLKYKDCGVTVDINKESEDRYDGGYCACIAFESEEEIDSLIELLQHFKENDRLGVINMCDPGPIPGESYIGNQLDKVYVRTWKGRKNNGK